MWNGVNIVKYSSRCPLVYLNACRPSNRIHYNILYNWCHGITWYYCNSDSILKDGTRYDPTYSECWKEYVRTTNIEETYEE